MIRALAAIALTTGLIGCTSPDYINRVHPDHPQELQRVNTPQKAEAFFADVTYITRSGASMRLPVEDENGQIVYPEPVFRAEYFAAGGNAFAVDDGGDRVIQGHWRIEKTGRGYPRLCRSYPYQSADDPNKLIMSEWECSWPNLLFKRYPPYSGLYRSDVMNLESGRMHSALRTHQTGSSLQTFLTRQGINPANLTSLKFAE